MHEGRGLTEDVRVKVFLAECGKGSCDRGLKEFGIPYAVSAPGLLHNPVVDEKDLFGCKPFHFASALSAGLYFFIKSSTCPANSLSIIPRGFLSIGPMVIFFDFSLTSTSTPSPTCRRSLSSISFGME